MLNLMFVLNMLHVLTSIDTGLEWNLTKILLTWTWLNNLQARLLKAVQSYHVESKGVKKP